MNSAKFFKKGIFLLLMSFIFVINTSQVEAIERVDINTATSLELQEITGVGPVISQRIIEARPYSSIDDLKKVKGIGAVTLLKIKQQGIAYVPDEEGNVIRYTVYYFLIIPKDNDVQLPQIAELNGGEYVFNTQGEAQQWIDNFKQKKYEEGYFAYYSGVCELGQNPYDLLFPQI